MITRFIIAGNFLQFYLILASNMYSYCIALFLDNDGDTAGVSPPFSLREGRAIIGLILTVLCLRGNPDKHIFRVRPIRDRIGIRIF
jgi:hypothetical protein